MGGVRISSGLWGGSRDMLMIELERMDSGQGTARNRGHGQWGQKMERLDAYAMAWLTWLGFGRLFVIKMYNGAMG
jgi:hypothetical protein